MKNYQNNPGRDGSCIVCRKGTDTGLIFRSRYVLPALMELGMPNWQANGTLQSAEEDRQHAGDTEDEIIIIRVCERCSAAVINKVGRCLTLREAVPYYRVDSGLMDIRHETQCAVLTDTERAAYDKAIAEGLDHDDAMCIANVADRDGRTYIDITPEMIRKRASEIGDLARDPTRWFNPNSDHNVMPPFGDLCEAVASLWDDHQANVRGNLGGPAVDSPQIRQLQVIARNAWGRREYRRLWGRYI